MKVGKAKRRLLRWQRYQAKTGSEVSSNIWLGGNHAGYTKAFSDVTYAKRYVPIGVREPWLPLWACNWGRRT